jgi:iron complex outermembrane receptor protein
MLLIREILDRGELLIPDFSAGTQYRLVSGKEYLLKANFSRNSKIPSLNDLYWMPGGNPDLRNEYSYTYELSATAHEKIAHSLDLKFDLTLFRNDIRDMIQWHPGEYSYWTADNIRSVRTSGLETSFSLGYSRGKLASGLTGNYSFTRAVNLSSAPGENISAGNQLIYVPEHQGNCTMVAGYGWFQASWVLTYTGRRYVTADNSDFLPGYVLNNLTAGCRFTTRATLLSLTCGVENIFNTSYQAIAHYPMPGRSFSMKLLIQISK